MVRGLIPLLQLCRMSIGLLPHTPTECPTGFRETCHKTFVIFALASVSRYTTAVLPGPSVRMLLSAPSLQSWSFMIVCRAFRGTGPLPSSLSHFLRQCPLGSKQACLCPESLSHTASSTCYSNPLSGPSLSAWVGMRN